MDRLSVASSSRCHYRGVGCKGSLTHLRPRLPSEAMLAAVYPLVTTRPLARPFTYEVPEDVGKGAVVSVRLGRQQTRGVVVDVGVEAPDGVRPVPVGRVLDEIPASLVDLALWLGEYYG